MAKDFFSPFKVFSSWPFKVNYKACCMLQGCAIIVYENESTERGNSIKQTTVNHLETTYVMNIQCKTSMSYVSVVMCHASLDQISH